MNPSRNFNIEFAIQNVCMASEAKRQPLEQLLTNFIVSDETSTSGFFLLQGICQRHTGQLPFQPFVAAILARFYLLCGAAEVSNFVLASPANRVDSMISDILAYR